MNITFKNLANGVVVVLMLALPAWAGGDGSDGHTHGVQLPAVLTPVRTASPRLSTHTEQFELVGVLEGKVLTLYLDKFGTNVPVAEAQIEIESGTWKAMASEVSPAVYSMSAERLTQPGKHPLVFTVQAGDATDLMDATLEVGQVSPANLGPVHAHFWGEWAVWWGAAALALAAVGLVLIRWRKHRHKHSHL